MIRRIALLLLAGTAAFAEATDSVYFDEELQVTDLLKTADDSAKKQDWRNAIVALQRIVEEHPASVLQDEPGIWLPATTVVRRRIAAMPAEAHAIYEEQYGTGAARIAEPGDAESLRRCAYRYFCTSAGGDAMERLGSLSCDTGALEMAMRCWEEVALRHPDRRVRPVMLAKLGVLYAKFGLQESLRELVGRHGAVPLTVRGHATTLGVFLAGAAAMPVPEPGPVAVNPDLSLSKLPAELPVPRSVKWRLEISQRKPDDESRRRQPWNWDERERQDLQTYPKVVGDALLVNFGVALAALDLETGAPRWVRGAWPDTVPKLFSGVPPGFWGHRFYVASDAGRVYMNVWEPGRQRTRLHCVDARSGRELWGGEGAGDPGTCDITGPPLIWRDRIYAGAVLAERPSDTWLLAFDKPTGKLLWSRFLATFEPSGGPWGGRNDAGRPAYAPVVAAGGSYLYVCSNNGAFACVSHDGEMIWAAKYPRTPQSIRNWFPVSSDETWDLNPVIFVGGDVLFFSSDGTHCCRVNGLTGKGWKKSSDPLAAMKVVAREECRHLLVLDGDIATLTGKECKLYDIRKLSGSGIVPGACLEIPKNSVYAGRGFATESAVVVPLRRDKSELWVFDRKFTPKSKTVVAWPSESPPGTLILAGKLLFSVSPAEIVALSEEPPKEEEPEDGDKPVEPPKDGEKPPDDEPRKPETPGPGDKK